MDIENVTGGIAMKQAVKLVFQKHEESYAVECFNMEEVEKICIGRACNLVVAAYRSENEISEQEQVAVVFLKNKPNQCFPLKDWGISFLYDFVMLEK